MFGGILSNRGKVDREVEENDSEALLPSSSTNSLSLRATKKGYPNSSIRIVIKTAILCTVVYLGVGIWLCFGFNGTHFLIDADSFCFNHIQQYCEEPCIIKYIGAVLIIS